MDRTPPQPITRGLEQVKRFQQEILDFPIPPVPTRLHPTRKTFALSALTEELTEFRDAETLADEADALLDMCYFGYGRLVEMGLMPSVLFDEVHRANMAKKRGDLKKARSEFSGGYDAVKPPGWTPPDLEPYFMTQDQIEQAANIMLHGLAVDHSMGHHGSSTPWTPPAPHVDPINNRPAGRPVKIIVLGHARHGKDTVSEMIARMYGLPFNGSSSFCAERVILPLTQDDDARMAFISRLMGRLDATLSLDLVHRISDRLIEVHGQYADRDACYADRHRDDLMRATWYEAIRDFNRTDQAALAKGIFEESDVYCGLRSKQELRAAINSGTADLVVWVDASDRQPLEPSTSITVQEHMAHFTIDNNAGLIELERNVRELFDALGFKAVS